MTENLSKIITIGTFDGVHFGHQKILGKVVKIAQENDCIPSVLTLFPHPRMVLGKDNNVKLLNTIEERIELLKNKGIKDVIVKEFTQKFANLSARDYVKTVLVDELNISHIVIGYDHHFGKNRTANITDLKHFAAEYNFKVEEISAQDIKDVTVSSTKIRTALHDGNVELANSYLGYDYFITGTVIKGKGIGRTINFPTANMHIKESCKLIPRDGVYVIDSTINDKTVYGMMNIGTNPTVDGKTRSMEVHFFNFNEDLYDKTIRIAFLNRLRSEKKFDSIESLKAQLKKDEAAALDLIKALNE